MMRLQSLVFACIVAFAVTATPACGAQVQWKLASAYPSGNFHTENLNAFAEEVADATGGRAGVADPAAAERQLDCAILLFFSDNKY
jgi:TRAP-type C4-dicarboxylate transport system substrate-binding protein